MPRECSSRVGAAQTLRRLLPLFHHAWIYCCLVTAFFAKNEGALFVERLLSCVVVAFLISVRKCQQSISTLAKKVVRERDCRRHTNCFLLIAFFVGSCRMLGLRWVGGHAHATLLVGGIYRLGAAQRLDSLLASRPWGRRVCLLDLWARATTHQEDPRHNRHYFRSIYVYKCASTGCVRNVCAATAIAQFCPHNAVEVCVCVHTVCIICVSIGVRDAFFPFNARHDVLDTVRAGWCGVQGSSTAFWRRSCCAPSSATGVLPASPSPLNRENQADTQQHVKR